MNFRILDTVAQADEASLYLLQTLYAFPNKLCRLPT